MLNRFYQRYSRRLVAGLLLTLPLAIFLSLKTKSNNAVETWMPETTPARQQYEEFKRTFGVEEFLLIAFDLKAPEAPDAQLIESVCGRLERVPGIRVVMSPDRMRKIMSDLTVPPEAAEERLKGILISKQGHLLGIAACLSEHGMANRSRTVADVREVLKYCQLGESEVLMAGAPLFVAELDRLGGKESNARFFTISLTICWILLYYLIREWRLTGLVYAVTLWSINSTSVILDFCGVEMNFVLASVPVLTMVLTMSVSVHYLYYYQEALEEGSATPISRAMQLAWWPTLIATLTTALGELALSVSDIIPIRQFAYASAFSSFMSMFAGLGLTPALLVVCPTLPRRTHADTQKGSWLANAIVSRSRKVVWATVLLTVVMGIGLQYLRSDMTVSEFLPNGSKVKQDFLRINRELACTDAIEAVVDCGAEPRPFAEKLDQVRRIEALIKQHPAVDQTLSATRFFPDVLPQNTLELGSLLKRASQRDTADQFTARGQQLWRVSVRVRIDTGKKRAIVHHELAEMLRGEPVTLTGLTVLVESAQQEILDSFQQSVFMALGLITVAMMIFLKSIWRGFMTMIPNVAPLVWVYGAMSWMNYPIDIAIMLSGSIALGMSVDGTFHFMSHFRLHRRRAEAALAAWSASATPDSSIDGESDGDEVEIDPSTVLFQHGHAPICPAEFGARNALLDSGIPFIQATLTAAAGMFGLTLSSFAPTARFGWVMMALMIAALVGDVLMLPALMYVTHRRKRQAPGQSQKLPDQHIESAAA